MRAISHTEVATALDCWAKHAFGYTGAMTQGTALTPKTTAPLLRDGRAWGAGVAQWHVTHSTVEAQAAIRDSLDQDRKEQQEVGLYDEEAYVEVRGRLDRMLWHYAELAERIPLRDVERELFVPIPSRTGMRASNRYRLHCFLDGVHVDEEGRYWIVEFKLRTRLSSDEQIAASRQTRWYAWAFERQTGIAPAGVIVDERLNALPAPVKLNQDGRPSKVQSCTPEHYASACENEGIFPDPDVLAQLQGKEWQKRTPVLFRPAELVEAGWQLVSAANLIHQLDIGLLWPIRNPSPARCPRCQFRGICNTPEDEALVDALFFRKPPKGAIKLEEAA